MDQICSQGYDILSTEWRDCVAQLWSQYEESYDYCTLKIDEYHYQPNPDGNCPFYTPSSVEACENLGYGNCDLSADYNVYEVCTEYTSIREAGGRYYKCDKDPDGLKNKCDENYV